MDLVHVSSATGNIVTSVALAAAGLAALAMVFVRVRRSEALPPLLALMTGAGLIALAADEGLELHDRVGRWLYNEHGVTSGPVNHVDDLIVFAYLAVAGLVIAASLPVLARSPRLLSGLAVAGVMFAAAIALDGFGAPGTWTDPTEEALEAVGALLLAFVFALEARRNEPKPLVGMRLEQPRMRSHAGIPR